MEPSSLLSIALAAFVFGISPGPGTLAALSVSTTYGFRSGLILSAGECFGDVMYLSIAILSLGYLAEYLEPVMQLVRWFGAGYLVYLGISQFKLKTMTIESANLKKNVLKQFFLGFLIGGTNPKVIVFYLSFIPLFVDLKSLNILSGLELVVTIYFSVFFSLVVVCLAGKKIKSFIVNPVYSKRLNRITGSFMISVGAILAFT